MMGMPIFLGWPVSLLGNSSREERQRRLTQFSSTRVFLIQARKKRLTAAVPSCCRDHPAERKAPALLLPLHSVDSWGFSEVACRGRPWEAWHNSLRKWWLQKEQAHLSHLGPGPWQLVIYLMYASCSGYVAGVLPSTFLSLQRWWFNVRISKSVLGVHCYMMWFTPVGFHMWKQFDVSFNVSAAKNICNQETRFSISFPQQLCKVLVQNHFGSSNFPLQIPIMFHCLRSKGGVNKKCFPFLYYQKYLYKRCVLTFSSKSISVVVCDTKKVNLCLV